MGKSSHHLKGRSFGTITSIEGPRRSSAFGADSGKRTWTDKDVERLRDSVTPRRKG